MLSKFSSFLSVSAQSPVQNSIANNSKKSKPALQNPNTDTFTRTSRDNKAPLSFGINHKILNKAVESFSKDFDTAKAWKTVGNKPASKLLKMVDGAKQVAGTAVPTECHTERFFIGEKNSELFNSVVADTARQTIGKVKHTGTAESKEAAETLMQTIEQLKHTAKEKTVHRWI